MAALNRGALNRPNKGVRDVQGVTPAHANEWSQAHEKVLRSKSDRAQLQGAVLKTGGEEAWDHFVQIKLWTHGLGWSIILKDPRHNTVVDVGPYWREEEAWKATRKTLKDNGLRHRLATLGVEVPAQ